MNKKYEKLLLRYDEKYGSRSFFILCRQKILLSFSGKNPSNDKVADQMCECGKKPAGRITEIKNKKVMKADKYGIDPYNTEAAGTKKRNDHRHS